MTSLTAALRRINEELIPDAANNDLGAIAAQGSL
jgi:hypothetical protein